MTPENLIKRAICQYLQFNGFFFWVADRVGIFDPKRGTFRRNADPFRIKGVSDVIGLLPSGRMFAIEVKTPTGKLSEHQRVFIDSVNHSGGLAFVARSVEDVQRYLKNGGPTQPRAF